MSTISVYKGDDTAAFGFDFLKINILNEENFKITRAEFRCGDILKKIENPIFPISIHLTSEETEKLQLRNICYLAVFDENGLKKTCVGSLTFNASPRKV